MRPFVPLFGVALLLTACGSTATTESSTVLPINSALYPFRNVACTKMIRCGITSSQMQFSATPDHGPPGTVVTLRVTGCIDPTTDSHGLSYNADSGSNTEFSIPAQWRNGIMTASYRIPDAAHPAGSFIAQCYDTMVDGTFALTK